MIAAAFYPKKVILRLSDFKSNEYANLIGGELYEPEEENPMLGFRGASRYVSDDFKDCFALECEAVKRVRLGMGLDNVEVMIPFVRSINEAENVIEILENNGLKRGEDGLKVIMMCELPTNALLAKQYLKYFDGSLSKIDRIPEKVKSKYLSAFEIDTSWFIECASRRQKWIDQAQSLNLYMSGASGKKLDETYKLAWIRGLKTTYYLRTLAATSVEKSTVKSGSLNSVTSSPTTDTNETKFCSIDDPECEACQ